MAEVLLIITSQLVLINSTYKVVLITDPMTGNAVESLGHIFDWEFFEIKLLQILGRKS